MGFFFKSFQFTKLALQFGCFAHAFNQYVAEVTWVKKDIYAYKLLRKHTH